MDKKTKNKLAKKITGIDNGLVYLKLMEVEAYLRVIGNVTAHVLATNQQKDVNEILNNMTIDYTNYLQSIAQVVIGSDDNNA